MLGALYVLAGFGADRRIVFLSDTGFAVWRFCATSADFGLHTSLWRCVVSESPRPAMAPNG